MSAHVIELLLAPVLFCIVPLLPAIIASLVFGWGSIASIAVFVITHAVLMVYDFLKDEKRDA